MATPRKTTTKAPAKKITAPTAAPAKTVSAAAAVEGPAAQQIAQRAYELWLASGGAHGHHEAHWLAAEQELRARATR